MSAQLYVDDVSWVKIKPLLSIYENRGFIFLKMNYALFKRKAFTTTESELNDIAIAANIGVSNNPVSG